MPPPLSPALAIHARGLHKRFGALHALQGVDLDLARGKALALLGPNGAGKSTLLSLLCTLDRPDAGRASVAGYDTVQQAPALRRRIGVVFQAQTLDPYLSVERHLRFHAALYGLPAAESGPRIAAALDGMGLSQRAHALVRTLSGGMRRRLEIARALLHRPELLFLDEPTAGLDPPTRQRFWDDLHAARRDGLTLLVATHDLDEAERCDRVAIVDHGRVVAHGAPAELKAELGHDRVRLSTADDERAAAALRHDFGIECTCEGGALHFGVRDGDRLLATLIGRLGVAVRSVVVSPPSLDDVFRARTGQTMESAGVNTRRPVAEAA